MTEAGGASLATAGITTIFDLRSSHEQEQESTPDFRRHGVRNVGVPVFEQDASPIGLEDSFPGFAFVYRQMLERGQPAYLTMFRELSRTGIAAALILDLGGGALGLDARLPAFRRNGG